jgi:hypothetical protein
MELTLICVVVVIAAVVGTPTVVLLWETIRLVKATTAYLERKSR